jgi:hypothetical protein
MIFVSITPFSIVTQGKTKMVAGIDRLGDVDKCQISWSVVQVREIARLASKCAEAMAVIRRPIDFAVQNGTHRTMGGYDGQGFRILIKVIGAGSGQRELLQQLPLRTFTNTTSDQLLSIRRHDTYSFLTGGRSQWPTKPTIDKRGSVSPAPLMLAPNFFLCCEELAKRTEPMSCGSSVAAQEKRKVAHLRESKIV